MEAEPEKAWVENCSLFEACPEKIDKDEFLLEVDRIFNLSPKGKSTIFQTMVGQGVDNPGLVTEKEIYRFYVSRRLSNPATY